MDCDLVSKAAEQLTGTRGRFGLKNTRPLHSNRLTRGQRLLAVATASAVLMSGINALAQLIYLVARKWIVG